MFPPQGQNRALQPSAPNGFLSSLARLQASQVAQLGAFTRRLREQRCGGPLGPRSLLSGCSPHIAYAAAVGTISMGSGAFNSLRSAGATRCAVAETEDMAAVHWSPRKEFCYAWNSVCSIYKRVPSIHLVEAIIYIFRNP